MDSLIAKADAVSPLRKKRGKAGSEHRKKPSLSSDFTLQSVSQRSSVPKSLRKLPVPDNVPKHSHIANKKLRNLLRTQSEQNARAQTMLEDADMFLMDEAGKMEVEDEMERTWRVGQTEIVAGAGQEARRGRKELKLDGGPYRCRYTRNGRLVTPAPRKKKKRLMARYSQTSCHCGSKRARRCI